MTPPASVCFSFLSKGCSNPFKDVEPVSATMMQTVGSAIDADRPPSAGVAGMPQDPQDFDTSL
jgi:hypothetical protein